MGRWAVGGQGTGGAGEACFFKLCEAFGGPDFEDGIAHLSMDLATGDGGHAADEPAFAAVRAALPGEIARDGADGDFSDILWA